MCELTDRIVELDALLGPQVSLLTEQMATAPSWPERFELVEAFLDARLAEARSPSPGVEWAWRRLRETSGSIPVGSLARDLGWSRKLLRSRFREEVGLTPKMAARIIRFAGVVEKVRAAESPNWADLAAGHGYFDQAHLTRDVRAFAGMTPTGFAAALGADPLATTNW
jgi:AraC-like DNA-binding protein